MLHQASGWAGTTAPVEEQGCVMCGCGSACSSLPVLLPGRPRYLPRMLYFRSPQQGGTCSSPIGSTRYQFLSKLFFSLELRDWTQRCKEGAEREEYLAGSSTEFSMKHNSLIIITINSLIIKQRGCGQDDFSQVFSNSLVVRALALNFRDLESRAS